MLSLSTVKHACRKSGCMEVAVEQSFIFTFHLGELLFFGCQRCFFNASMYFPPIELGMSNLVYLSGGSRCPPIPSWILMVHAFVLIVTRNLARGHRSTKALKISFTELFYSISHFNHLKVVPLD